MARFVRRLRRLEDRFDVWSRKAHRELIRRLLGAKAIVRVHSGLGTRWIDASKLPPGDFAIERHPRRRHQNEEEILRESERRYQKFQEALERGKQLPPPPANVPVVDHMQAFWEQLSPEEQAAYTDFYEMRDQLKRDQLAPKQAEQE